jgi:centrosomal protein CEP104
MMKAGGKLDNTDAGLIEELRRLDHLHFLTIFGARIWTGIHVTNWRHREAAAKAVLNFIEMPLVSSSF